MLTNERRIEIECKIATRIIEDASKLGLYMSVNNGGEDDEIYLEPSKEAVLKEMFATDEDRIIFHRKSEANNFFQVGWVHLVYGNDGYDLSLIHISEPTRPY